MKEENICINCMHCGEFDECRYFCGITLNEVCGHGSCFLFMSYPQITMP